MRRFALFLAGAPLVLGVFGGCARTAEERQLDAMRADIDHLQGERDRVDRPALVQRAPGSAVASAGPAGATASIPAFPSPEPVAAETPQAEADGDWGEQYADPEDTTPRPRIVVLGSPRVNGREFEKVDDGSAAESDRAGVRPLDPQAKPAYDAAMSLVAAKKYDAALDALAAFLVRWPDHPYADHAMYWRGECYFARGDYAHASEQLEGVIARFPAGAKVPDALLELGIAQQRLGNSARARECFERLAHEFPQSDAARRLAAAPAGGGGP